VFNLTPRGSITAGRTLGHVLGERGYRTIFATDEVRFSNVDESYGFDDVITPVIGASDFIVGSVADIPLVNLVNATAAGRVLFPDVYANRAAASTYRPRSFTALLDRELDLEGPTFLAVHFTLTHWPYYWADSPPPPSSLGFREAQYAEYGASVSMVDRQVGEFLELLRRRGALTNALVVILSDHGEAMYRAGDSLLASGAPRELVAPEFGHGNSVLSRAQYEVLMAFAGYGSMHDTVVPGSSTSPASLEDIVPTVLDLLRVPAVDANFDGLSLRELLRGRADPIVEERVRFTETDFTLPRMLAGEFNVRWIAENAIDYYRVNPASGWVELRNERLPAMMAYKERAAIGRHWLMAALPAAGNRTSYWLINRDTGEASAADTMWRTQRENASILYRALHERFPGELQPLNEAALAMRMAAKSPPAP
jgi:hypothetical protein